MGISNSQKIKEKTISEIAIVNALRKVRRNRCNAEKLFQLLEKVDDCYIADEHFKKVALGRQDSDDVYAMERLYQSFSEAYIIRLLEKYLDYSKRDLKLLLAVFGLLPNYKKLSVKERRITYAEKNPDVKFGNNLVSGWSDPNSRLQGIENEIIDKVARWLDRDTFQNEKPLGLASAVLDELAGKFPGGLPEELPADFLKRIRIDSPSDKVPLQDETSENDKIEHTGQVPNIPIEISGEGTAANELASEDSTLEKLIAMQSRLQTWRSILKTRKEIISALTVVSIIFVIVVIIIARYLTALGDSDPPIGKLFIRDPEGTEESEYNFTLDAGKGTVINIYGMPDDADIEDLEIWIRPEDTDLITVEPIPTDMPKVLPLLIKAQEIGIEEAKNREDESKINIVTIVVIYEKTTPVCMNVTVVPDSGDGFGTELLKNGGGY